MNCKETANRLAKALEFKAALATSMHASAATVPLKAQFMAMGVSNSAGYQIADADSYEMPSVARLLLLLPALTDPTALDFLAGLMGRTTYLLPAVEGHEGDRLPDVLRTFATVVEHHGKAIKDGTFCYRDADKYRQCGLDLVRAVLAQIAHVDREAASAPVLRRVTA